MTRRMVFRSIHNCDDTLHARHIGEGHVETFSGYQKNSILLVSGMECWPIADLINRVCFHVFNELCTCHNLLQLFSIRLSCSFSDSPLEVKADKDDTLTRLLQIYDVMCTTTSTCYLSRNWNAVFRSCYSVHLKEAVKDFRLNAWVLWETYSESARNNTMICNTLRSDSMKRRFGAVFWGFN